MQVICVDLIGAVFSGFGDSGDRSNTKQRSAPPSAQVSFIKSKTKRRREVRERFEHCK